MTRWGGTGAQEASEVLRCLMSGHDDRIAISVLAAMRRQGVGLGETAAFTLADEYPALLQGLTNVVGIRLAAALKTENRGHVQLALNDAISLGMPEETVSHAQAWLDSIAVARAEALAARKARKSKRDQAKKEKAGKDRMTMGVTAEKTGKKEAMGKDNFANSANSNPSADLRASAAPSAAATMLFEAQGRLVAVEMAAAVARRARRDVAKERTANGSVLTPSLRRTINQQMATAIDHMPHADREASPGHNADRAASASPPPP